MLTEKIAAFVEEGFVKGPFDSAPMPGFRANTLMAVHRNDKVRPVINMSGPLGGSFNSNTLKYKMEKIRMTTAKNFSYDVKEAGLGALMTKFDLKDAFKLIPAKREDWKLQGFKWLGKFFIETQMIFGAVPSVSNFDRLGNTVVQLSKSEAGLPGARVSRTLDDIAIVSSKGSGVTEKFTDALIEVCSFCKVPLAQECPLREKAFSCETKGIVLGVGFDTEKSEWFLTKEKVLKHASRIVNACEKKYLSLNEVQKVMGTINDFVQMCPFMKIFQASGNMFLASFGGSKNIVRSPDVNTVNDWLNCARAIICAEKGMQIAKRPGKPGLECITFVSDAAGSKYDIIDGVKHFQNGIDDRGVACIWVEKDKVKWLCRKAWSSFLLEQALDSRGKSYGNKTTTLEAVGLVIPFVTIPEFLAGKDILFKTDNIAVVFGWESKSIKFDRSASILIKAVAIMSAFLGCRVFVEHLPRMTTMEAELADHLSRASSVTEEDWNLIADAKISEVKGSLCRWIQRPFDDENLPFVLLEELKSKF